MISHNYVEIQTTNGPLRVVEYEDHIKALERIKELKAAIRESIVRTDKGILERSVDDLIEGLRVLEEVLRDE